MTPAKDIIVAIDGFASCGKSSLAKSLARTLNYRHIDTGAMYRAVTWYFLKNQVDWRHKPDREEALDQIAITFENHHQLNRTLLNGQDVETVIRSAEVNQEVSEVSVFGDVREKVVALQRSMGKGKRIVMEGRDIGTVVFPEAELKIFLTASLEVRTDRRFQELMLKGVMTTRGEVQENLLKRDYIDSHREISPLRKAKDAWEIDNSDLTILDQQALIVDRIRDQWGMTEKA
ncbi:MAG: (d)CMP kinase [Saprospiraceae bacterium]|nr:(d)CMP kinase [Saprospiraceae bacterium]MCB9318308.1 (d)CMP kinase [Lewinellaceae bacterium]